MWLPTAPNGSRRYDVNGRENRTMNVSFRRNKIPPRRREFLSTTPTTRIMDAAVSKIGEAVLKCLQATTATEAEVAWDCLVPLLERRIYCVIRPMVHSRADAEDCVQKTLVKLTEKIHTIREPEKTLGWCCKTAVRLVIDAKRKSAREPVMFLEDADASLHLKPLLPDSLSPSERAEFDEAWKIFDQIAADSNPEDGPLVILRVMENLEYPEIGDTVDISEDAARMRVDRFLEKARMIYERDARRIK
jgi:RNA polymerase sigma-70 factor, ECF subfamily